MISLASLTPVASLILRTASSYSLTFPLRFSLFGSDTEGLIGFRFVYEGGNNVLLLDLFESALNIARSLFFKEIILPAPYGESAIEL